MIPVSEHVEPAYRGVDLTIGFKYPPSSGEDREGLIVSAFLFGAGARKIDASSVSFDPVSGEVVANWDEATTQGLVINGTYEARFVRSLSGQTRVFYIRRVLAQ